MSKFTEIGETGYYISLNNNYLPTSEKFLNTERGYYRVLRKEQLNYYSQTKDKIDVISKKMMGMSIISFILCICVIISVCVSNFSSTMISLGIVFSIIIYSARMNKRYLLCLSDLNKLGYSVDEDPSILVNIVSTEDLSTLLSRKESAKVLFGKSDIDINTLMSTTYGTEHLSTILHNMPTDEDEQNVADALFMVLNKLQNHIQEKVPSPQTNNINRIARQLNPNF